MNDGVTVCINMLRSVLTHFENTTKLLFLKDDEIVDLVMPFGTALGDYFARMSIDDRLAFRRLRGVEGQTTGRRLCEEALRKEFPEFEPPGLDDWIQRRKENTNDEVRKVIERMEKKLQESILNILKEEFPANLQWWFVGVAKGVRKKVDDRINEAGGGGREESFDLIDYRSIITSNWQLFKDIFGYGPKTSSKDKQTKWLHDTNEMRKVVVHASRRDYMSLEDLQKVQMYEDWLDGQLADGSVS